MEGKWSRAARTARAIAEFMADVEVVVSPSALQRTARRPVLHELMGKILDGPVMMHRMHIGRVTFPPNTTQTTPAHQDWQYIRGTATTYYYLDTDRRRVRSTGRVEGPARLARQGLRRASAGARAEVRGLGSVRRATPTSWQRRVAHDELPGRRLRRRFIHSTRSTRPCPTSPAIACGSAWTIATSGRARTSARLPRARITISKRGPRPWISDHGMHLRPDGTTYPRCSGRAIFI